MLFMWDLSCTSSYSQDINIEEDTIILKTVDPEVVSITFDEIIEEEPVLLGTDYEVDIKDKRIKRRKEIKPMEIDSTWELKNIELFEQLEETRVNIQQQQATIDSLLLKKKKG